MKIDVYKRQSIGGEDDYKQYIIDNNGIIISHKDKSMIGNSSDLYSKLDGDKGEIKRGKNIIAVSYTHLVS